MLKRCLLLTGLAFAVAVPAQVPPRQIELADLQEDVRGLTQRVNDLSLQVEQLDHEKGEWRTRSDAAEKSCATVAQLNQAVADLNRAIQSAVATSKDETLQRVGDQMAKLARQTNAALDALANSPPARAQAAVEPAAPVSVPGGSYTVQHGDTLASIAKKTGARIPDIIAANKLSDPSRILIGQTLLIPAPGGK